MTHDSQLLMSSLRQLSPTQALTLAQYLLKLLGKYSGEPHSSNTNSLHNAQIIYVVFLEQVQHAFEVRTDCYDASCMPSFLALTAQSAATLGSKSMASRLSGRFSNAQPLSYACS